MLTGSVSEETNTLSISSMFKNVISLSITYLVRRYHVVVYDGLFKLFMRLGFYRNTVIGKIYSSVYIL